MDMPRRTLYRLLYRSRQTASAAAHIDSVVAEVIAASIPRNRAIGLTGLLLVVPDHFIQALEGDIDAVRTTYARISMDSRHHDLHIIAQGSTEQRLFGEWNMCARALAPSDAAILKTLDGKRQFSPKALTAESARRLLITVADIQRRVAAISS